MNIEELKRNPKYRLSHTAWSRGYISRKIEGRVYEYNGRYGKGYTVHRPSWKSTQYHLVDYYIEKD